MREPSRHGFPAAPAIVLAVWAISLALYDLAPPLVGTIAIIPYGATLVLGASFVYPSMRRRGNGVALSTVAATLVPALWMAKECWAMSRMYTVGEALYYALNPIALGLYWAIAVQISVAELLLQRRHRRRWALWSGAGLTLAVAGAATVFVAVVAHTHDATVIFWTYVDIDRWLFGG
jgi:GNAT superfamily N-acetyltransferase